MPFRPNYYATVKSNWSYSLETPNSGQNQWLFVPCDLETWQMTLKNNMTPLLCYFKFCASFHSHQWNETGVTVRKGLIWVKIDDFHNWRMTLKNNRAPLLCYSKLCASFHSHQWNQTGATVWKRTIRVKIDDCLSRVTLKFDGWPWKTIDLEIWQMTLKNNRAPLPYYLKLCASFCSHQWI